MSGRSTVRRLPLALVAICGFSQFSMASGVDDLSPDYMKCLKTALTNIQFDACGAAEINKQEARLALAWKKAVSCFDETNRTEKDAKQSLVEEERLWIKWKVAACGFYFPSNSDDANFGFAGREGQTISAPSCRAGIVSQRASFLEGFAKSCHGS